MPRGVPNAKIGTAKAKADVVSYIADGKTVTEALAKVKRSRSTYEAWRRNDADFKARIDRTRVELDHGYASTQKIVPDFPEFCEKFLHMKLYRHQLQWFDMMEGREPRELHPAETYTKGKPSRLIVNVPPGHAKSTTLTVAYVVWRIVRNPNVRVAVVSKAQRLAEQFLLQIKEILTDSLYGDLQVAFAPPGGWDGDSAGWSAGRFYVSSSVRSSEQKDPTVQALGLRAQVYGSRLDLVILDDCIDNTNVGDIEKQIPWVLGIVASRLAPRTGRIIVIGTRIAAKDMYSELDNPERYFGGISPWTTLKQPAVLEIAEDPKDWVTLWPVTTSPGDPDDEPLPDGTYRRWDGETLSEVRDAMPPAEWSRMYMQEQVAEDSIFQAEDIVACRGGYPPGNLIDDNSLGREGGKHGLKLIAGLDPAVTGHTAAVLIGLDVKDGHRYVIDVYNKANCSPDEMRSLIRAWTDKHGIDEWRIEKNSFQGFLTQDTEVRNFLANRGCILTDHFTGNNKHDADFGVAAMGQLFRQHMITTPTHATEAMRAFVEQLISWSPGLKKGSKTDVVMALWFAELRCQELMKMRNGSSHRKNMFQTRGDRSRQQVVSSEDLKEYATAGAGSWWQ